MYFKEDDIVWNSDYGGGETLLNLTLKGKKTFTEEDIKNFMRFKRLTLLAPISKLQKIDQEITKCLSYYFKEAGFNIAKEIKNSLISLMYLAGTLPSVEFEEGENLFYSTPSPEEIDKLIGEGKIKINPITYKNLFNSFTIGLIDGYIYNDPFYKNYAEGFFHFLPAINKAITLTLNPTIKNIDEFEKEFDLPYIAHFMIAAGIEKEKAVAKKDILLELIEEKIINPITENLPIDKEEILITTTRLVTIEPEARKRAKEYLSKNPNLQLNVPNLVKDILIENQILD